jgi:hypothetical protein
MSTRLLLPPQTCLLVLLGCFLQTRFSAAQFVQVNAEIEVDDWRYRLLTDDVNRSSGLDNRSSSIFGKSRAVHCVIGTNIWMLELNYFGKAKATWWFTGSNIVEQFISPAIPEEGHQQIRVCASSDGNPGRPSGVADLMIRSGSTAKLVWLAWCSGSALKREGHEVFPPSDLWKEYIEDRAWTERAAMFDDGLGLPRSITLSATNNQPIFQYRLHEATNVLGWNFPMEFYAVEYLPTITNGWWLQLTAKGRVTSIAPGAKPAIPPEVEQAAARAIAIQR